MSRHAARGLMSQRPSQQYTITGRDLSRTAAVSAVSDLSGKLMAAGRCSSSNSSRGSTSTSCAPASTRRRTSSRVIPIAPILHLPAQGKVNTNSAAPWNQLLARRSDRALGLPRRRKVKGSSRCLGGDDRALAPAVCRVLRRAARGQRRELIAGARELGQPGLDFGEAPGDQAGDVHARRLSAVADVHYLADVLQREPGRLSLPDEGQA